MASEGPHNATMIAIVDVVDAACEPIAAPGIRCTGNAAKNG